MFGMQNWFILSTSLENIIPHLQFGVFQIKMQIWLK